MYVTENQHQHVRWVSCWRFSTWKVNKTVGLIVSLMICWKLHVTRHLGSSRKFMRARTHTRLVKFTRHQNAHEMVAGKWTHSKIRRSIILWALHCMESCDCKQELMSSEAAKERVTPVPSKCKLLTYFCFGSAQCTSCGLSTTFGHATTWEKDGKFTSNDAGLCRRPRRGPMMARLNGELFICCIRTRLGDTCCIRTRLGDTCCNQSLRFEKVYPNGEGSRNLQIYHIFVANRFHCHPFAWPFHCG